VQGRIQRSREGIIHLLAETLTDRTALLGLLDAPSGPDADAPRLPLSRDFR
jgi:hypothetical protein